ncbi:MAG: hypothetical protein Q4C20_00835 [Erysipelotrichaceae bacterium]|nr:hypothetical protein [Erysipelotrichaceae bacterium]
MIDLTDYALFKNERESSKGNQLKWHVDENWYKADYLGYEGLVESIVSKLLSFSSLKESEYIDYDTEQIRYKYSVYNGCISRNFLGSDERLITLNRLFLDIYGIDLYMYLWGLPDEKERMEILVDKVVECTGLSDFGEYLCKMMEVDMLFQNEDRHFHNIALIQNERGEFRYSPFFDHGACLLSDTKIDYPIGQDLYELIGCVKGKTFSTDLEKQAETAEAVYGVQIHFKFSDHNILEILKSETNYDEETKSRVLSILREQKRKYRYLFD